MKNFSGHNTPINALAVNEDGVAVSCGDNGTIDFWDYETGYCFQKSSTIAQPGSLDAECGIYAAGFDLSGRYEKQISKQASKRHFIYPSCSCLVSLPNLFSLFTMCISFVSIQQFIIVGW